MTLVSYKWLILISLCLFLSVTVLNCSSIAFAQESSSAGDGLGNDGPDSNGGDNDAGPASGIGHGAQNDAQGSENDAQGNSGGQNGDGLTDNEALATVNFLSETTTTTTITIPDFIEQKENTPPPTLESLEAQLGILQSNWSVPRETRVDNVMTAIAVNRPDVMGFIDDSLNALESFTEAELAEFSESIRAEMEEKGLTYTDNTINDFVDSLNDIRGRLQDAYNEHHGIPSSANSTTGHQGGHSNDLDYDGAPENGSRGTPSANSCLHQNGCQCGGMNYCGYVPNGWQALYWNLGCRKNAKRITCVDGKWKINHRRVAGTATGANEELGPVPLAIPLPEIYSREKPTKNSCFHKNDCMCAGKNYCGYVPDGKSALFWDKGCKFNAKKITCNGGQWTFSKRRVAGSRSGNRPASTKPYRAPASKVWVTGNTMSSASRGSIHSSTSLSSSSHSTRNSCGRGEDGCHNSSSHRQHVVPNGRGEDSKNSNSSKPSPVKRQSEGGGK